MALFIDGFKLPIDRWQLDEILDKRLGPNYNTRFSEFFVVARGPEYHQTKVECKYGQIPVFFVPNCPTNKIFVLNRKRFPYPSKKYFSGKSSNYDQNGDLIQ